LAFSLAAYERLLDVFRETGRALLGVADTLDAPPESLSRTITLRHDVDRFASRAVALASRERRKGIAATYYFRCTASGSWNERAITAVADLGHEVGYHHETLSRHNGHIETALEAFARNLASFRQIAPCVTVSMHGAPLSAHDNRDLTCHIDFAKLGLKGDAVDHMTPLDPVYLTDTGGRWNADGSHNLRDRVGQWPDIPDPDNASSFRNWLATSKHLLYLNTHPERWASSALGQAQAALTDAGTNLVKRVIVATSRKPAALDA